MKKILHDKKHHKQDRRTTDEWQENICNIYQKKELLFSIYKEILIINWQRT